MWGYPVVYYYIHNICIYIYKVSCVQGEYLWRTDHEQLKAYVERHLRSTPTWSSWAVGQEWFSELLRGLCVACQHKTERQAIFR